MHGNQSAPRTKIKVFAWSPNCRFPFLETRSGFAEFTRRSHGRGCFRFTEICGAVGGITQVFVIKVWRGHQNSQCTRAPSTVTWVWKTGE